MAGDEQSREDEAAVRGRRSSDAEIESFRNRRQRPKPLTRPPADKVVRPAPGRGYETK